MTVLSRKSGGSGGGGAPSGPAGGDLSGTYPNPTIVQTTLPGYELDYAEITSPLTVTATTAAAAQTIVAAPARVYSGTTVVMIEFFSDAVVVGSGTTAEIVINLWDGATNLGRLAEIKNTQAGATMVVPVFGARRLTPSAASHTYTAKAWRVTTDGTVQAGTGGVDAHLPAFIRATVVSD